MSEGVSEGGRRRGEEGEEEGGEGGERREGGRIGR